MCVMSMKEHEISDRRYIPEMPNITVQDSFDRIYNQVNGFLNGEKRRGIENEAYKSALEKLDHEDRKRINQVIQSVSNDRVMINMGPTAARELLAKLGIWLIKAGAAAGGKR